MAMLAAMALAILARNSQVGIGCSNHRAGERNHRADRFYARVRARGRPSRLPHPRRNSVRRARAMPEFFVRLQKRGACTKITRRPTCAPTRKLPPSASPTRRTGFRGSPISRRPTALISETGARQAARRPGHAARSAGATRRRPAREVKFSKKLRRAMGLLRPYCAPKNRRAREAELAPLDDDHGPSHVRGLAARISRPRVTTRARQT